MTDPTTPDHPTSEEGVSRRGLLAGLGALGGGVVAGGLFADAADAQSTSEGPVATRGPGSRATPITSTIASAHLAGINYEYRAQFDFSPESSTATRAFGGFGVHSVGAQTSMWTSVDLPRGAQVHDVEWYLYNTSGSTISAGAWIWTAGSGYLNHQIATTPLASGSGIRAARTVVADANKGPYPAGCRLLLTTFTPTNATVQVNGVRVGYRPGAMGTQLLATPVRAYDSRSTAPFAPNESRTISLAGAIPAGAVGAVLSLSVTGAQNRGTLRLGAGGATPTATAIQWSRTGDQVTTAANTALSAARTIAVKSVGSTGNAHVIVDVVGYLS